jgi:hypothetical protein
VPAERSPPVVDLGDVHRAVDRNGEAQARRGAELQHPDAAFGAVGEFHKPHAAEGRQLSTAPSKILPRQGFAE